MSLKLGGRKIEARSDGGVNFYPEWGLQTYYPMLSIEVIGSLSSDVDLQCKRKKHKLRNAEASHQRHAAQMYAEMLGQAYKSKLYKSMSDPDGYQEVNPGCNTIDLRRSCFTQDILHSTSFILRFSINISKISQRIARITKTMQQNPCISSFNI